MNSFNNKELRNLRQLTSRFLYHKAITGANGQPIDDEIRVCIAAQACVLVLNLSLEFYNNWYEIIVYPDTFVVTREETDAYGIVHQTRSILEGEAWDRGPVVLSWADAQQDVGATTHASNVVLHEFAHKLDMRNGVANGMPPLHADMDRHSWTQAFSEAFEDFLTKVESGNNDTGIDAYAASDPAEFFAVLSEVFFVSPDRLNLSYPTVYEQLVRFYRQDPLARLSFTGK